MSLNILIAPDKFKGTLTAAVAAQAIARGWRKARRRDVLKLLPMSDGGDGFGKILGDLLGATAQRVETVDAAGRPVMARWWWEGKTKTAVIESAEIVGLAMLPPGKFHPFELDTFGLGAVIEAAAKKGARRCLIGIGGSATNDGGFGLARALGWKFFDRGGAEIGQWTALHTLATVRPPKRRRWFKELVVAVDVQNPLLGQRGATRVYGAQKGLRPAELAVAEKNLRGLARVLARAGLNFGKHRGAGAAGGLGFGLLTFLGARAEPGFEVFARWAKLEAQLRSVGLVITGEGRVDASTLMGKGVGQMAMRCGVLGIPCVVMAGVIENQREVLRWFAEAYALADLTDSDSAVSKTEYWLECLGQLTAAREGLP